MAAQNEEQPLVLVLWPCVRLEPSGGYIKNDLLYGGSPFMTSRKLHFMSHLFSAHRLQFLFLVYLLIKIEDDVRQLHTEMANYASCLQLQCTDRQILASSSSSDSPTTATNTTLTHTHTHSLAHLVALCTQWQLCRPFLALMLILIRLELSRFCHTKARLECVAAFRCGNSLYLSG